LELEDTWAVRRPGRTFGATSILTAAFARHTLAPETYPLFLAAGRGLAAIRASHEIGGGTLADPAPEKLLLGFDSDAANPAIPARLHPAPPCDRGKAAPLPEAAFRSTLPDLSHFDFPQPPPIVRRLRPSGVRQVLRDQAAREGGPRRPAHRAGIQSLPVPEERGPAPPRLPPGPRHLPEGRSAARLLGRV